jgi:hypothetical protein
MSTQSSPSESESESSLAESSLAESSLAESSLAESSLAESSLVESSLVESSVRIAGPIGFLALIAASAASKRGPEVVQLSREKYGQEMY